MNYVHCKLWTMFEKKIIFKKWSSVYHKNNIFEIFKLSCKTKKK